MHNYHCCVISRSNIKSLVYFLKSTKLWPFMRVHLAIALMKSLPTLVVIHQRMLCRSCNGLPGSHTHPRLVWSGRGRAVGRWPSAASNARASRRGPAKCPNRCCCHSWWIRSGTEPPPCGQALSSRCAVSCLCRTTYASAAGEQVSVSWDWTAIRSR